MMTEDFRVGRNFVSAPKTVWKFKEFLVFSVVFIVVLVSNEFDCKSGIFLPLHGELSHFSRDEFC